MELILYIALGIVLGYFLLAFIDKVIVAAVIGVVVVVGFVVLFIFIAWVVSMSSQERQEFGAVLLFIIGILLARDLTGLVRYAFRVASGIKRIEGRIRDIGDSADHCGEVGEKKELTNSPYAASRYVLQRKRTVGFVTIDGADSRDELTQISRFGVIAHYFFNKKHRVVYTDDFKNSQSEKGNSEPWDD